jgi:hypothetical protein
MPHVKGGICHVGRILNMEMGGGGVGLSSSLVNIVGLEKLANKFWLGF